MCLRNEAKSLLESLQMAVVWLSSHLCANCCFKLQFAFLLVEVKFSSNKSVNSSSSCNAFYCYFLDTLLNLFSLANCLQFCSSVLFLEVFLEFLILMSQEQAIYTFSPDHCTDVAEKIRQSFICLPWEYFRSIFWTHDYLWNILSLKKLPRGGSLLAARKITRDKFF